MPLDRDQFDACIDLIVPHVTSASIDRREFVTRALRQSPVLTEITWTGNPRTFVTNLVERLIVFDDTTSLITLLEKLRDDVGEPTASAIATLIQDLAPPLDALLAIAVPGSETTTPAEARVFISYAHEDSEFVDRLCRDFETHRIPYWIDKDGFSPGTPNWERDIRAAIEHTRAIVLVASPASYRSEYVNSELAVAGLYERIIYPIWAEGDSWEACVPPRLHNIRYVDMRPDDYGVGLAQLVATLRGPRAFDPVPAEPVPDLPPGQTPENPFKGLQAFQEKDTGEFFGRELLVARLITQLGSQLNDGDARFLALLGLCGVGKSSVVMAGLLPALKKSSIPGSGGWTYLPHIAPGVHPVEHLAAALKTHMPDTDLDAIEKDLNAPGGRMLHLLVRRLPGERIVLYIDQFEELYALTADDGERQRFINLITYAVTEPGGKLVVLLSMRTDFLDRTLNHPTLGHLFDEHSRLVKPMSIAELCDAIGKPARLPDVCLSFDPGLVAEIIFALRASDTASMVGLPLLQFTLERLYEERDGTCLTWDAYDDMGGVDGAIDTHSDALFSALPRNAQERIRAVFRKLVNINEDDGEPTRCPAPLEDVVIDPDAQALVDALLDKRLLQISRHSGSTFLEIAHEALFRSWSLLAEWIGDRRADLCLLREMRKAAKTWEQHRHHRGYLWLGERNKAVQKMLVQFEPDLNKTEREFARPEQEHLLDELENIEVSHARRAEIGQRLLELGDLRPGVGLSAEGPPDIEWCYVGLPERLREQKIEFIGEGGKFGDFEIAPFYIARYLITCSQFQAFMNASDFNVDHWWAGMPEEQEAYGITYRTRAIEDPRRPASNYPRDTVSWYQAVAFCRWLSHELGYEIRLPTEQEWQWAAQNGPERREYPWESGTWDGRRCNTNEAALGRSTAVGMYPHGTAACGALDMAGNLWEWCLNKYDNPNVTTVDDSGERRVVRGGSWFDSRGLSGTMCRGWYVPADRAFTGGFRVVRPTTLSNH
jgi:formylglycine-generating enzyme required for sulfatase activity